MDTRELGEVRSSMADAMGHGRTPSTKSYDNSVKIVPSFLLKSLVLDQSNYREILVRQRVLHRRATAVSTTGSGVVSLPLAAAHFFKNK